jgi:hypothetical protein
MSSISYGLPTGLPGSKIHEEAPIHFVAKRVTEHSQE